jgi:hypothetical protein
LLLNHIKHVALIVSRDCFCAAPGHNLRLARARQVTANGPPSVLTTDVICDNGVIYVIDIASVSKIGAAIIPA